MKRTAAVCILLLVPLLSGCPVKSREAAVKENIAAMKEATEVLGRVQDEDTAKAARPRLLQVGRRMGKAMHTRMSEQLDEFNKDTPLGRQFRATQKRYADETRRVEQVPGGRELLLEFCHIMLK